MTSSRGNGDRDEMVPRGQEELIQYQGYRDWTEQQVLLNADEFITKYELHDLRDILRKGALLAHDPTNASYAKGLEQDPPILANTIAARPPSFRRMLQFWFFVVAAGTCNGYDPDAIQWVYVMPYLAGSIFTALLSRCLTSRNIMLTFGAIGLIRSIVDVLWLDMSSDLQIKAHKLFLLGLGAVQMCTAPVNLAEISEPGYEAI
ncbi:uncharacterized protein KD926_000911 [Aspergillus affinis]|uniref:uncharacterized protein n=1 Tax=Aspergillus affinis TaxID=1070780 RepID=UPI0022FE9060|nr:uncharacterized protein KD926_000911 [Aspergillus affinis]KAI9037044.1 hypothetical protein KD926_000911 [Aspergillus affinis]